MKRIGGWNRRKGLKDAGTRSAFELDGKTSLRSSGTAGRSYVVLESLV